MKKHQASPVSPESRLVSASVAASLLGIPYTTLRDLGLRGQIPVVKVGSAWYFERADLDAWVNDNKRTLTNAEA